MPKSIVDWFKVNDPKHIAAYQFCCVNGHWPEGFIPNRNTVAFPVGWPALLAGKIAEQLLAQRDTLVKALFPLIPGGDLVVIHNEQHPKSYGPQDECALCLRIAVGRAALRGSGVEI